jgi:hypothetical protein
MNEDLIYRLRKRAEIRRQIADRKSVQEGKPDRISDLLEEAANALEQAEKPQVWAGVDFDIKTKPQREWVGLTDEEIDATWGSWMRPYAHMVLNKLKEKNT